jgi:hypothetical protein
MGKSYLPEIDNYFPLMCVCIFKKKRNSMEVAQFLSNIGLKDLIQTFQGK